MGQQEDHLELLLKEVQDEGGHIRRSGWGRG